MSTAMSPLRSRSVPLRPMTAKIASMVEEPEEHGAAGDGAVLDDERHENDADGDPDEHQHAGA